MTSDPWPAPTASGPVVAEVTLPGSKSMTNRALLLAALATGPSRLRQPLRSRDTALMVVALRALGAAVDDSATDWMVGPGAPPQRPVSVDVGNAGTVLRFAPPVAGLVGTAVTFDGDAAVRRRPIAPLLAALRRLGVVVDDAGRGGLPFAVRRSAATRGGAVEVDASGSSQLVSGLLLAGAAYPEGVSVRHVGARPVPNAPHLAMTVAMLRERGVSVNTSANSWVVAPGPVAAVDTDVEPDLSTAAPFLAAAVVTGGQVTIHGWPATTTQPGGQLPELLARFGAQWELTDGRLVLTGTGVVTGADVDLRDAGELTPAIAAVAAVADRPSRLTGIDYLRGHETDRLAALARELSALGAAVTETTDGLEIAPKPLQGNVFATYDDHRLVMAAAVLGLVVPGVQIENVATVAKTMPEFTTAWTTAVAAGSGAVR